MSPTRIQCKRTKGWKKPEGAIYVGRPSRWGNPFQVYRCECCGYWDVRDENGVEYHIDHKYAKAHPGDANDKRDAARRAVELFAGLYGYGWLLQERTLDSLEPLRGHDLMCWCPPDQPCHADVLLELANEADS